MAAIINYKYITLLLKLYNYEGYKNYCLKDFFEYKIGYKYFNYVENEIINNLSFEITDSRRLFYLQKIKKMIDDLEPIKKFSSYHYNCKNRLESLCTHYNTSFPEIFISVENPIYPFLYNDRKEIKNHYIDINDSKISHDHYLIYLIFYDYLLVNSLKLTYNYIHNRIKELNTISNKKIPSFTFCKKYNKDSETRDDLYEKFKRVDLKNLFKFMKSDKNKLIHPDDKLVDFYRIFSNETPKNKITWLGTIEQLTYFVRLLHLNQLVKDLSNSKWPVTSNLFKDKNKLLIPAEKLSGQVKPKSKKKAQLIEEAINILLK
ncbi:MAG: hypothetical protein ACOYO1_18765 [Bacteroidales bacterium]